MDHYLRKNQGPEPDGTLKEKRYKEHFYGDWEPKQKTKKTIRLPKITGQYQIRQLNQFTQQIWFTEKEQKQFGRRFLWEKQTDTETSEDHLEKRFELEKECDYPELIYESLISKFIR